MQPTRADSGRLLTPGDVVQTDDASESIAEVLHRNGAVTRLDRLSEMVIDRTEVAERPRVVISVGPGRTWHHSGPLDDPTLYEVRSPAATATARFAVFSMTVHPDGTVDIAAVRGHVIARGATEGSVVVSDGQQARISADGRVHDVGAADLDDPWIDLNRSLDDAIDLDHLDDLLTPPAEPEPEPEPERPQAPRPEPVADELTSPLPRWLSRTLGVGAVTGFVALLAVTFITAQNGDRTAVQTGDSPSDPAATSIQVVSPSAGPLPAGAAALIRAAQDRSVAPETKPVPTTTTTTIRMRAPEPSIVSKPVATVPAAPNPAPTTTTTAAPVVPTATASGTQCAVRNSMLVFTGTVRNTSTVTSGFAIDTVFTNASGARFASATAKVTSLAPQHTATWQVQVAAPANKRGATCDVAGVRPL
jgi:hypothetical protein